MASDTYIEEERDMVTRYVRARATAWEKLNGQDPVSSAMQGELNDLADEIEAGRHWVAEE